MKFQTYSVDKTLEINDSAYHITGIGHFPFKNKNEFGETDGMPWYFEANWVSFEWQIRLGKVDRFFSFPFTKDSSTITVSGTFTGDQSDLDMDTININNSPHSVQEMSVSNMNNDMTTMKVALTVELEEKISSLNTVHLQMGNGEVSFQDLDNKKENHYMLSPIYSEKYQSFKP
ncbi:hypothetical protein GH741_03725 [Aquibacillus halophilus]|uniref:Uncharacterized protein n=1 Tax=Aquibacillus halophilus TaxID=930132 RepID=A0A6A8D932_9BACI|nr:hypothetical protein [Aquibacillus halophilus]MRH41780.1 hypothetical protein [Aquibacillus halophilus]